ncbi:MAG TPA: hypothetical protein VFB44_03455 [Thermoleophilaceae bacterium]|nr:hypothetical protein [Thermoleophilaceae bacterium]
MGFLDFLGGSKGKLKAPAADRLFAMTTAQITLDTGLGLVHRKRAGIVFQPVATADFQGILTETEELLAGAAEDTGTVVKSSEDEFGYRWLILEDADFEDLVVSLNTVSVQLQGGGYGDRLLCAVFAFEEKGKPIYFIYNFKRGAYYPFVPAPGDKARDSERELRLKAQVGAELPFEEDMGRWFPLWEIPL